MKILVFSDTHGHINSAIKIIETYKNIDMIIHLGDYVRDAEDLEDIFINTKVEYVKGNNDYNSDAISEKILELDGEKIFLTHGHNYKVKYDYMRLMAKGEELMADAVLFGHTHKPYADLHNGCLYFNPGSLTHYYDRPSYGLIEINDGIINYMICEI